MGTLTLKIVRFFCVVQAMSGGSLCFKFSTLLIKKLVYRYHLLLAHKPLRNASYLKTAL